MFFRCPPTAPAPGQNCYTLPDASDPCCNITVCDDPVLDPDENVDKAEQKQPRIINDGGGIGINKNCLKFIELLDTNWLCSTFYKD